MSAEQITSPRSASSLKLGLASPTEFKGRGTAALGIATGVLGSVAGVLLLMYVLKYLQDASYRTH